MLKSSDVKRLASEVGFDACGIAPAEALTDDEYPLRQWLARGFHADLGYMERNVEKRMDPSSLVEGAKSVICVVLGYNPSSLPSNRVKIARYAYGNDYHDTIRGMLYQLRERLKISGKPCCDTVPISDKHWAARAGLGWIGRHTLLVTPEWGTWVNLGEIVTTEECDYYDTPIQNNHCHRCRRCVDACPNHALSNGSPAMIDLRRCTAYHTIESHSPTIPNEVNTSGYAFGCDLCQIACPYNQRPNLRTRPISSQRLNQIESLADTTEEQFLEVIKGTSMSRVDYAQWRRNLDSSLSREEDLPSSSYSPANTTTISPLTSDEAK